jgi:hypothetical protein
VARDKKTGMSAPIDVGGHYDSSKAPSLKKGTFQAVGTYTDEGDMTTVTPSGTSVNKKTGYTQVGSSEF